MPLCAIFKDLAFQSLCLIPNNIDFVLSCLNCILNLLSTNPILHFHVFCSQRFRCCWMESGTVKTIKNDYLESKSDSDGD